MLTAISARGLMRKVEIDPVMDSINDVITEAAKNGKDNIRLSSISALGGRQIIQEYVVEGSTTPLLEIVIGRLEGAGYAVSKHWRLVQAPHTGKGGPSVDADLFVSW